MVIIFLLLLSCLGSNSESTVGGGCCLDTSDNLALGSLIDSPDGIEEDQCEMLGGVCEAGWACDGNKSTYWDEADGEEEYVLRVRLPEGALSGGKRVAGMFVSGVRGSDGQLRAPRDWTVVCDGRNVLGQAKDAAYNERGEASLCWNPAGECRTVELFIGRAYGGSPAIAELAFHPSAGRGLGGGGGSCGAAAREVSRSEESLEREVSLETAVPGSVGRGGGEGGPPPGQQGEGGGRPLAFDEERRGKVEEDNRQARVPGGGARGEEGDAVAAWPMPDGGGAGAGVLPEGGGTGKSVLG